ncbi:MAG: hypothetical protein AAFR96_13045 [Planctomycetota bacterium]
MAGQRRVAAVSPAKAHRTAFIAGGLSVLAVALLVFVLPFDDDNIVVYIVLGVVHALAIAPISWLNPEFKVRGIVLSIGAATFGIWSLGMFLLLGFLAPFVIGLTWAVFAGLVSFRPLLGFGLTGIGVFCPFLFLVPNGPPVPGGASSQQVSVFLVIATWHLVATLLTYGECARRKHIDSSHCTTCGYSLKGLPTTTCPECGEPITPPASPPSAPPSAP